jgi:hypothetical protein
VITFSEIRAWDKECWPIRSESFWIVAEILPRPRCRQTVMISKSLNEHRGITFTDVLTRSPTTLLGEHRLHFIVVSDGGIDNTREVV